MKRLHSIMKRRSIIVGCLVGLALFMNACATFKKPTTINKALPKDPDVDEARIDITQDLAYSQALIKIGHVKGAGGLQPIQAEAPSRELQYTTDGLRVVLVFGDRPAGLDTIDFFNWERLADYR